METGQPSRTAQGAAMHRAAHQLADRPLIFADPLALRIIGIEAEAALRTNRDGVLSRASGLRAIIAIRSRYTEDCLAAAIARGVRQYVLLGAGLDTFAYRAQLDTLQVFEVDHPATQAWKRARLAEVGIAVPPGVTFAPLDFERETLEDGLTRAGFVIREPALFAWLGVTPYLSEEAVMATLAFVAALAKGTEIVFDYPGVPATAQDSGRFEMLAARVAAAGEPFVSLFEPDDLQRKVRALGFASVEDLDGAALTQRYLRDRTDGLAPAGRSHLMHTTV